MLLEEGERQRNAALPQQPAIPVVLPPVIHHAVYAPVMNAPVPAPRFFGAPPFLAQPRYLDNELDWLLNGGEATEFVGFMEANEHFAFAEVNTRHWFTAAMIENLECRYCNARLNSMADLRYHLAHTTRHPVFACCGKFFAREDDYEKHRTMAVFAHRDTFVRP